MAGGRHGGVERLGGEGVEGAFLLAVLALAAGRAADRERRARLHPDALRVSGSVGTEREFVARTGRHGKLGIVVEFSESLRNPDEGLRFGDMGRHLGGVDAAGRYVDVGRTGEIGLVGSFGFGIAVLDGYFVGAFGEDVFFGLESRDALPRAVEIGARDPQGEFAAVRGRDFGAGCLRGGFCLGVDREIGSAGDADRAATPPAFVSFVSLHPATATAADARMLIRCLFMAVIRWRWILELCRGKHNSEYSCLRMELGNHCLSLSKKVGSGWWR